MFSTTPRVFKTEIPETDPASVIDEVDNDYKSLVESCFGSVKEHNCFIINPFVKWGKKKQKDTSPQQQMEEAVSLINTLSQWKVQDTVSVPLDHLDKIQLFGTGNLEKLKQTVRDNKDITAVFINVSTLKSVQLEMLEKTFRVPILDRYKVVMQILKMHANTKHAKLQVALAEIPYLRGRIKKHDTRFMSTNDFDTKHIMLRKREQKLRTAIQKLRFHRELLRHNRNKLEYPVIAVVGYTNAGKTSLIKALTGDKSLKPKNQLFATLDVTMHAGVLPSNLEVLYVDTVGFISNIPTDLIECFVATLEDALHADVILHVEDLSSKDVTFQRNHVLATLKQLSSKTNNEDFMNKIVTVGNKSDIVKDLDDVELPVSAKTESGIDLLRLHLEKAILENTNRRIMRIRIPIGGDEIRWLYKNAAVVSLDVDEEDSQQQLVKVIITKAKLEQFKHHYLKRK